ncbi:hypothetical protein FXO38_28525 [Capsicum annuum]|uniref:uncharacterized protein LOC107861899 isoform X1 n=1 Tax=Capsicum annuum TaxID=4072 RepID=UPI001FB04DFA|nr:uncharacterized protein LOC107861899 isoform X1 [Capsicum annuum]XP_016562766.2 uncharacterized protein LOC107861899 isoform X1 [Capsicum annuum]XP_047266039.1 uncharacterized protein LOC107861899 isoform X1 [Capsicum annuum]XP_047266040.1 uncharacterized protein LOC107861899 isoform X1 [Capsicum annuum]XP_047266041.1 uncharacterized protein LOC107861899 isoform X1 [Capsicum annuum]KAF3627913.1 hypothetical protein FXO38_28525 [Capsicum annuum]
MSDHPKIHHKRRRSQLLAYGQHLLYGLTSQQHLFAGRFLLPAVVQPGTSRIDQSRTGNHSPLGGSGCSSLWTTSRQMREAQTRRLVVGTIHVLYNPGHGDVKLGQKLCSDHLALVSEFEFLEVVGDKKEATEDRTII